MAYRDRILGLSGLLSFWELQEPAGSSSVADSQGSVTGTPLGTPTFGEPGILGEGGLSVLFAKAEGDAISLGDFYDFASTVGASSYIDPSADGANNAWTKSTGTAGWSLLDEGTRQPTAPSTGTDRITSTTDEQLQDLVFPNTLTYAAGRTYTLWIYGSSGAKRGLDVQVSNNDGATWQTRQVSVIGASAAAGWYSVNITSWVTSQTQLDQLRVRLICNATSGGGGAGSVEIDAVYVEQSGAATHAPFTLEAVVKVGTMDAVNGADILTKLATTGWRLTATTTNIFFRRHDSTGASDQASWAVDGTWTAGSVHHLVATYDGTSLRLYYDGVLKAGPSASSKSIAANAADLRIGAFSGGGNNWDGNLQALAIYDRALTDTEAADNYAAGIATATALELGKVSSGEAVGGIDLTQSGPVALGLGKIASGQAVHGADLSAAGPVALTLGKVATGGAVRGIDLAPTSLTLGLGKITTGEAVRGANLSQSGPLALDLGKIASGQAVRGVDLTEAGPVTLALGKVATGAAVRGANLSQTGPIALDLGKVASDEDVRGVDLTVAVAGALVLGKVPSGAAVRGISLSTAGPVTLGLGKVTSGEALHGIALGQSGPVTLALGRVASGAAVRGVDLTQSGPVTLTLGGVSSGEAVRGVDLSVGPPPLPLALGRIAGVGAARGVTLALSPLVVSMTDSATAFIGLVDGAGSVELTDEATASVTLTDTPT